MEPVSFSPGSLQPVYTPTYTLNADFNVPPSASNSKASHGKVEEVVSRQLKRSSSIDSKSEIDAAPRVGIGPNPDLSIHDDLVRVIGLMLGDKNNPPNTEHVQIKIRSKLEKDSSNKPNLQTFTENGKSGFKINCMYTIEIQNRETGETKTQIIKRTLYIGNVKNNDPGNALKSLTDAKDLFAGLALHVVKQPTQLVSPLTQELTSAQRTEGAFVRNQATGAFEILKKDADRVTIGNLSVRVNKEAKSRKKYHYQMDQKVAAQYDEKADKSLKISDQKLNKAIITRSEKIELAQSSVQNQVTLKTLTNEGVSSHIDHLKEKTQQLENRFNSLKVDPHTPFIEYRFKPISKGEKESDAFKQMLIDSEAIKQAEAGVFSNTTGVKLSEKRGLSNEAKRYINHLEQKIDIQNELVILLKEQKLLKKEQDLQQQEKTLKDESKSSQIGLQKQALENICQERDTQHKIALARIFDKYPGKMRDQIQKEVNDVISSKETELKNIEARLESDHKTLIEERSQNYINGRFRLMMVHEELENKLKHIQALKKELEQTNDKRHQFDIENLAKLEKQLEKTVKEQATFLNDLQKQMGEIFSLK